MTNRNALLFTGFGLVLSLSCLNAHAQTRLGVDDAALCAAALDLSKTQTGLSFSDQALRIRASDWFTLQGRQENDVVFTEQHRLYEAALSEAYETGDPQFSTTVRGCLTYFETSQGHTPDL